MHTYGNRPSRPIEPPDLRAGRSSLSAIVAEHLEWQILRGDVAPGDRLPTEQELEQMFGVSRTVVRDAIRTLAARGFVETRHGGGTVVAAPSNLAFGAAVVALLMRANLTVGDVIDARAAIETQTAGLAALRGTASDWDALAQHYDSFAEAVSAKEWHRAHDEHLAFHLTIIDAIKTPALQLLLCPLQQFILISSVPPEVEAADYWEVPAHEEILRALRSGDRTAAEQAMQAHFHYMTGGPYAEFRAVPFREAASLERFAELRRGMAFTGLTAGSKADGGRERRGAA